MATPQTDSSLPAIVLTPGAWLGHEVFGEVRALLGKHGYRTNAVTLATANTTDSSVGLAADVAAVRSSIKTFVDEGKDVVVVAHGYGGVPSSCAVEGLAAQGSSPGVIMVLYMASFAVESGSSLLECLDGISPSWWNVENGLVTPNDTAAILCSDIDSEKAQKYIRDVRPMPLKAFEDPSTFAPWEEGIEVGYIFTEEDRAIDLDVQIDMSSQFSASAFTESLSSGHMPFLSMPQMVADTIDQAAKRAVARRPR